MPSTLTLNDIPEELYERLKASAQRNHRTLSGEAIVCLGLALVPERVAVAERLARARAVRTTLAEGRFRAIDALKREGRQ